MSCVVIFKEFNHLLAKILSFKRFHFLIFLLFLYNSWKKSFDNFLLLFFFILYSLWLIIFFWIFILVFVLFNQYIEIKTNHKECSLCFFFLYYLPPLVFAFENIFLWILKFLFFEITISPNQIDFEQLDRYYYFDFIHTPLIC